MGSRLGPWGYFMGYIGFIRIPSDPSLHVPQEFSTFPNEAFAKFMGGYQRLKEGSTAWALSAMTGDPTRLSGGPKAAHCKDVASPSQHPGRIFVRSENGMWTRKELEDCDC